MKTRKRRNPSRMTTLAALQYRHRPEALRELRRESSPADETLEEAQERLYGYTGQYANREATLVSLAEYVRASFRDAQSALRWLVIADRRLGVWCAAKIARSVVHLSPDESRGRPLRAIETAEAWVQGQATPAQVRAARDGVAYSYGSTDAAASASYCVLAPSDYVQDAAYYAAIAARNAGLSIDFMAVVINAILTFPVAGRSNPSRSTHQRGRR